MTTNPDLRPLLQRAFTQAHTVIAAVRPDQWSDPTPCTDLDVRGLIGHLLAVADRIAAMPTGVDVTTLPWLCEPGDDVAADFAERGHRATTAWADDSVLDRILTAPWGKLPGFVLAGAYVMEVVTHTWDLAAATGQTGSLDDDLGEATLGIAHQALPGDARDGFPFDPPVPVADGADPYTQLAAWMGRRPVPVG
jgi:uncharacterized protein (TIGR03086 family)